MSNSINKPTVMPTSFLRAPKEKEIEQKRFEKAIQSLDLQRACSFLKKSRINVFAFVKPQSKLLSLFFSVNRDKNLIAKPSENAKFKQGIEEFDFGMCAFEWLKILALKATDLSSRSETFQLISKIVPDTEKVPKKTSAKDQEEISEIPNSIKSLFDKKLASCSKDSETRKLTTRI